MDITLLPEFMPHASWTIVLYAILVCNITIADCCHHTWTFQINTNVFLADLAILEGNWTRLDVAKEGIEALQCHAGSLTESSIRDQPFDEV